MSSIVNSEDKAKSASEHDVMHIGVKLSTRCIYSKHKSDSSDVDNRKRWKGEREKHGNEIYLISHDSCKN